MNAQRMLLRSFVLAAACAVQAGSALADTQTFSSSIPLAPANWSNTFTIPRFDPAQGTLTSVTLHLGCGIEALATIENLDPIPQVLTTRQSAIVQVGGPGGGGTVVDATAQVEWTNALSAYDGVTDGGGTSGATSPPLTSMGSDVVTVPAPGLPLGLSDFVGAGVIHLPAVAAAMQEVVGAAGNLVFTGLVRASANLTVTYDFVPPSSGAASCAALPRSASLLLFPEYDSRPGTETLLTVTNTNDDFSPIPTGFAGTVDVEFVYIGREGVGGVVIPCLEFNRSHRLTPNDTLTVLTRAHNPQQERGYVYAFAKSPLTGQAIAWNFLAGTATRLEPGNAYTIPAFGFESSIGQGMPTDVDGDGRRDLDGIEYAGVPDELLFPRFLGQAPPPGAQSSLILIHLSGGAPWTAVVAFLLVNDNAVTFTTQTSFTCWRKQPLSAISGLFTDAALLGTAQDPTEPVGLPGPELGWFKIDGLVANSAAATIVDPAILACLIEEWGGDSSCVLPFQTGTQSNGALPPNPSLFPALDNPAGRATSRVVPGTMTQFP